MMQQKVPEVTRIKGPEPIAELRVELAITIARTTRPTIGV
jgi:hypothetical protein